MLPRICGLVVALVAVATPGWAAEIDAEPSNYRTLAAGLNPGDTLRLAPGRYVDCLTISGLHGTAQDPIVIEGAAPYGGGVVFAGAGCPGLRTATIFVEDSSHVVIRNLEIDLEGAGANGIRAGYGTTPVHHLTVEALFIHDNAANNQFSGIGAFCTTWDWVIRFNRIERTGLGMYLGDSDGSDPFIRGTVEHNLILNPRGYGAQIKHQVPRVMVAGMPASDSITIVRRNVFIKSANAGMGPDARPNLLIGDLPASGIGANDRYEIYGNFFFENETGFEPLIQGEGNLSIHDNLFVNSFDGNAITIRPHNGAVRSTSILHNTFLVAGTAISINGAADPSAQRVVANAIYGDGMPLVVADTIADNVTGTRAEASTVFTDTTPTLGMLDLFPVAETTLKAGAPIDLSALDVFEADVDFDGQPRDGTWRGAYARFGTNDGWRLAAEPRPALNAAPPTDGGVVNPTDAGPGPVVDAGLADARADDAGQPADASTPDAGTPAPGGPEDEGCSCRVHRGRTPPWVLLGLIAVMVQRGRRREHTRR